MPASRAVIGVLLVFSLILTAPMPAVATSAPDIMVLIDGHKCDFDPGPCLISSTTMVPMRAFFEKLGASVDWDGTTRCVTATKDQTTIRLTIGDRNAFIDGQQRQLTVPAQLLGDRTFVPLRFVGEALGAYVNWDRGVITVISEPPSTTWKGEYFNNVTLSGSPVLVRQDALINFTWGSGVPALGINADGFSARWTNQVHFATGLYRFTAKADSGLRLFIDGQRAIDQWGTGGLVDTLLQLEAGEHEVCLETHHDSGSASAQVFWSAVDRSQGPGDALNYNGKDTVKVLALNYDPIVPSYGGKRLHEATFMWHNPRELAKGYEADLEEVSGGRVDFQVMDWVDIDSMPPGKGTYTYTADAWMATYEKARAARPYGDFWSYDGWSKDLGDGDYLKIINDYNIAARVKSGEIDEVWVFAGAMVPGFWETTMAGPGTYWCNSYPADAAAPVDSGRPFVISVFNYQRDVDCMLEDFGHRTESIMMHTFGEWRDGYPSWSTGWSPDSYDYNTLNKWEKFTLYDKVAPGHAAAGNVHFAPNSIRDYEWGNKTPVSTTFVDWQDYPSLTGDKVVADCSAWGSGNMRLHHRWWLGLLPKADGVDEHGYLNNWWHYLVHFHRQ